MAVKIATFLSVYIMIYGGAHAWFLTRIVRAFSLSRLAVAGIAVFFLFMVAAPILVFVFERQHWEMPGRAMAWAGYVWQGFFLLACSTYGGLTLLRYAWVAGATRMGWIDIPWVRTSTMTMVAAMIIAMAALVVGLIETRTPKIRTVAIKTEKSLGNHSVLRVALISDVHIGVLIRDTFVQKITQQLNNIQPDMILCAGDLLDSQLDHCEALALPFAEIRPPLGKYAVLGNHEYMPGVAKSLAFLNRAGFHVLRGEVRSVNSSIQVVGVDDAAGKMFGNALTVDEDGLLGSRPKDVFTLFIKHRPQPPETGVFDLMVSGHTHGGQIFPFHILTRLAFPYHAGRYERKDKSVVYVSRGTGTWGPPIRLGAPPEITVLEIQSLPVTR